MRFISGLVCLTILSSCGKDSNNSGTAPTVDTRGEVSKDELAPQATITPMTKASLSEDFTADSYLAPSTSASSSDCVQNLLSSAKIVAEGHKVTINTTIDTAGCYIDLLNGLGGINTKVTASASFHSTIECLDVDVGIFNGQKATGFDPNAVCTKGYTYLDNSRASSTATSTVNGQAVNIIYSEIKAESSPENEPCSVTVADGVFRETGCVEVVKAIDTGAAPYSDYTTRVHKDLTWTLQSSDSWYVSGSMDLRINDWTGSIIYAGAETKPAYSVTNGTDTLTGSFDLPLFGSTSLDPKLRALRLKDVKAFRR